MFRASVSRRRFLEQAGRGTLATLALQAIPTAVRAIPLGGPAGIQLYAVKDALQRDPAATLHAVRAMGFGEVETAGFAGLPVQEFRRLLDAAGLTCPSAHLPFDSGDAGIAFEQAHVLGARYAASGSLRAAVLGAAAGRGMSLEEAQRTAELANRLGDAARRAGLRYAYHNHDFEFVAQPGGAVGYDLLLRETDPALVEFEIDCGWMVLGGRDPREYFRKYPGRFPLIHVKDFLPSAVPPRAAGAPRAGAGPAIHPGAELGQGMIDYAPIFAVAEHAGLRHYFAEQEGPFTRMSELEAARQACAYLRRLS